jgi:hypothetical protein
VCPSRARQRASIPSAQSVPLTLADSASRRIAAVARSGDRWLAATSASHSQRSSTSADVSRSKALSARLQQILFETADSLTAPAPPRPAALVSLATA